LWDLNNRDLLIQQALPDRDTAFRELVRSGTHDECWQEIHADPDED